VLFVCMQQHQRPVLTSLRLRPSKDQDRFITKMNEKYIRTIHDNATSYYFDNVFDDMADNYMVFNEYALQFLKKFISGHHASLCAYGQTSSGKTHTMQGYKELKGLIQISMDYIFEKIPQGAKIQIQFFEIYNEKVYDLLDHNQVEHDKYFKEFRTQDLESTDQFYLHYQMGNNKRHQAQTTMNIDSSRSHSILKIILLRENYGQTNKNTFQFIDLAGSEAMLNENRLISKESLNINKSLSSFSTLITQLLEKQKNDQIYINFRDSALTFQFKDCLNSNSLLGFIFTINIQKQHQQYTQKTLNFSQTVGSIRQLLINGVKIGTGDHKLELIEENRRLLQTVSKQKSQIEQQAALIQTQQDIINQLTPVRLQIQQRQQEEAQISRESYIKYKRSQARLILLDQQEEVVEQLHEKEQQILFQFRNIYHYQLLADLGISNYSNKFITEESRCQRQKLLFVTEQKDTQLIKNQIIQLYNFEIQNLILFQFKEAQYYIYVQLLNRPSINVNRFNQQQQNLLLINQQIDTKDVQFLLTNLQIRYELQKNNYFSAKIIQFKYFNITEVNIELTKQLIADLDIKDPNIINVHNESLRFLVILKDIQNILIWEYFSQYHKPIITLLDENICFLDTVLYCFQQIIGKEFVDIEHNCKEIQI
ncbi:Kinesin-like protein kip2, partial [Paramecium bursaria]